MFNCTRVGLILSMAFFNAAISSMVSFMFSTSRISSHISPVNSWLNRAIPLIIVSRSALHSAGRLTFLKLSGLAASREGITISARLRSSRTSFRCNWEPFVRMATGLSVFSLRCLIILPIPVCSVGSPDAVMVKTSRSRTRSLSSSNPSISAIIISVGTCSPRSQDNWGALLISQYIQLKLQVFGGRRSIPWESPRRREKTGPNRCFIY